MILHLFFLPFTPSAVVNGAVDKYTIGVVHWSHLCKNFPYKIGYRELKTQILLLVWHPYFQYKVSWNLTIHNASHGLLPPDCWSHPQSLGHCINPIRQPFSPPSHTLHQTSILDLGIMVSGLWPQASSLGSSLGALELKIHLFIPYYRLSWLPRWCYW